jgi:hypothetical protein
MLTGELKSQIDKVWDALTICVGVILKIQIPKSCSSCFERKMEFLIF